VKPGVQLNVPDVFPAPAVNVAPEGRGAAVNVEIVSASGSVAVTVNVRSAFSATVRVAGAVTAGARSTLFTVIAVEAFPLSAFEAVNVTLYVPACVKPGVQLNVPDVFDPFFVNVAPEGSGAAVRFVIALPSGSEAVTVNESSTPSFTDCVAGAVTTGGRSVAEIVIAVAAVPVNAFVAVNVTLYVPAWPLDGVQLNVPDVFPAFFVNVAPEGSGAAVRFVIASPS
jgi:hypothetical protein